MRFVFTSDLAGLGGGEVGLLYLIDYLQSEHQCLVIVKQDGPLVDELMKRDVPAKVINYKERRTILKQLGRVHSILAEFQPDAVFSNDPTTSVLMRVAGHGVECGNYWIAHGQWYDFSVFKRMLLAYSNRRVFCVSEAVKKCLTKQGLKSCDVSYLGVPKSEFSQGAKRADSLVFPDQASSFVIVTIARFQKIKGQLKGVDAVARLIADGFDVQYFMVGGSVFGNSEDDSYERRVQERVRELALEDRIHFLGERRDIADIMKSADCLLIPSDNESLGLVSIEAIMSGLPIVSTPNDGVKEVLQGNKLCISPSNDSLGLYRVLKHQLSMTEVERRGLHSFYEQLRCKYSVDTVAESILRKVSADLGIVVEER